MPPRPSPAVDPVFAEIAKAIYGDVDPREIAKFAPGGSDVHTDGPLTDAQIKRQKKIAYTGLGATSVAGVAGLHALKASGVENKVRVGHAAAGNGGKAVGHIGRLLRVKPTTAAKVVGGAMLGLHGVELGADALGLHAQTKALRQAQAAQKPKDPVVKAFRLKPLNAIPDQVPSLRAKRPRRTPLATKGELYQPMSKGVRAAYRGVKQTVQDVRTTASNAGRASQDAAETAAKVKRLIPTRRTAVLMGTGALTALTGATYAGTRAGSYAGTRPARPKKLQKSVETDVTWTGVFSKVDADKRQVFGWASVSKLNGEDVVDLQGDIVPIEETEKAAYKYVIESRKGGDMHKRVSKFSEDQPLHTADMIESFVVTPEKLEKMGLPADALPHGWWVGYHVNDDKQWEMVKSGERAGFSIHGSGTRTTVSKARHSEPPLPVDETGGARHRARPRLKPTTDTVMAMPKRTARPLIQRVNAAKAVVHRNTPTVHAALTALTHRADPHTLGLLFKADRRIAKVYSPGSALEIVSATRKAKLTPLQRVMRSDFDYKTALDRYRGGEPNGTRREFSSRLKSQDPASVHRANLRQAADAGHSVDEIFHAANGTMPGNGARLSPVKGVTGRSSIRQALGEKRFKAADRPFKPPPPEPGLPFKHRIAVNKSLREDLRGKVEDGVRRSKIKERTEQAVHPPAVSLTPVKSSAITRMGYQKQTRRLAVEMQSRQGEPYQYRLKPSAAKEALDAPSLGHHYATRIRDKAKRPKHYTLADRARLFADPQVSKRLVPIGKALTS